MKSLWIACVFSVWCASAHGQAGCFTEQAELGIPLPGDGDQLGFSVALSGGLAILGAPFDKDSAGANQGAAYVYSRTGASWSLDFWLSASDAAQGDRFGWSVDISDQRALIGSPEDDDQGPKSGSAYVFDRVGCCWNQAQKLLPLDGAPDMRFGEVLALDADVAVVGQHRDGTHGAYSGAVYVFRRSAGGWLQEEKIFAPDGAVGDQFGWSVAIRGDTLLVGAPLDDDLGFSSGAAYWFEWDGSAWLFVQKVLPSDGASGDCFGLSVATDGSRAAFGAPGYDIGPLETGMVYVFRQTGGSWIEQAQLHHFNVDTLDRIGERVAIQGDLLAAWIPGRSLGVQESGAVCLFVAGGASWGPPIELQSSNLAPDDYFGASVDIEGEVVLAGAPRHPGVGSDSGSAYVFVAPLPEGYCQGKANSSGCVPFIETSGLPSTTASTPFLVTAADVVPGEAGFLIYGFNKSNLAFHGGRLCVKAPFARTPVKTPKAGGACSGSQLRIDFSTRIQSGVDPLLTAGQVVRAQWFQRDPQDPSGFGDGLSDGVQFVLCP